jgi:hypothetical protein
VRVLARHRQELLHRLFRSSPSCDDAGGAWERRLGSLRRQERSYEEWPQQDPQAFRSMARARVKNSFPSAKFRRCDHFEESLFQSREQRSHLRARSLMTLRRPVVSEEFSSFRSISDVHTAFAEPALESAEA